jgi:hypothetical protein
VIPEALLATVLHLHHGERSPRAVHAEIIATAAHAPSRWRAFQKCVERRESNNQPRVVNASGHMGLYQFSRDWAHGLPFMVAERLRDHGMSLADAKALRKRLSVTAINRWPANLQRVGFSAAISVPGNDRHWALANSRCEVYR